MDSSRQSSVKNMKSAQFRNTIKRYLRNVGIIASLPLFSSLGHSQTSQNENRVYDRVIDTDLLGASLPLPTMRISIDDGRLRVNWNSPKAGTVEIGISGAINGEYDRREIREPDTYSHRVRRGNVFFKLYPKADREIGLFIPSSGEPDAVMLILHGAGQNGPGFVDYYSVAAERENVALIAPNGSVPADSGLRWDWDTDEAPMIDNAAVVQTIVSNYRRFYDRTESGEPRNTPIAVFGYSRGGDVASMIARSQEADDPGRIDTFIIDRGRFFPNRGEASAASNIFILHGEVDGLVDYSHAEAATEFFLEAFGCDGLALTDSSPKNYVAETPEDPGVADREETVMESAPCAQGNIVTRHTEVGVGHGKDLNFNGRRAVLRMAKSFLHTSGGN